jgi:hypothetical protein
LENTVPAGDESRAEGEQSGRISLQNYTARDIKKYGKIVFFLSIL